jgi:hypothetical protein
MSFRIGIGMCSATFTASCGLNRRQHPGRVIEYPRQPEGGGVGEGRERLLQRCRQFTVIRPQKALRIPLSWSFHSQLQRSRQRFTDGRKLVLPVKP